MRFVLPVVLAAVGLTCIVTGGGHFAFYADLRAHEAPRFAVDLSARGEYRGAFEQKYLAEHGKQFRLEVDPPWESAREAEAALRGLAGRVDFLDGRGEVAHRIEFTAATFRRGRAGLSECARCKAEDAATPWLLAAPETLDWGRREVVVTVDQPAAGLAGRGQQIVGRNIYCSGEESFALLIATGMIGLGVLLLCGAGAALWKGRAALPAPVSSTWRAGSEAAAVARRPSRRGPPPGDTGASGADDAPAAGESAASADDASAAAEAEAAASAGEDEPPPPAAENEEPPAPAPDEEGAAAEVRGAE